MKIAGSSAFRDDERVLPQHQAALTLLQERLASPSAPHQCWLDLACGRGQIITSIDKNLSEKARAKIEYWAYDEDHDYAKETQKIADRLGFASRKIKVGSLSDFDRVLPSEVCYDFITVINAIHEIEPFQIADILAKCIGRLTDSGTLFIYDMEKLKPPELGALPWSRDDIRGVFIRMLNALGETTYQPEVGLWNHRTCNGWNVQIQRQHLSVSRPDMGKRMEGAINETRNEILQIIRQRLDECRTSLDTLTIYGPETAEELEDQERLLYEFFALSRALEHNQ